MAEIVTQVSFGFDEAKKAMYDIMKRYYPKIGDSKSTLVNAFVSGLAYLYAMWQVFTKLARAELYVSTARELESLYKLVPFVGIDLHQPIPMTAYAALVAQNPVVTAEEDYPMFVEPVAPFVDGNGVPFSSRVVRKERAKVFDFTVDAHDPAVRRFRVSTDGLSATVSAGQALGETAVPMSTFQEDAVAVEFPYWHTDTSAIRIGRARMLYDAARTSFILEDAGSEYTADISFAGSLVHPWAGEVKIKLLAGNTFDIANLIGQPVNMSWTVRPAYLKGLAKEDVAISEFTGAEWPTKADVRADPPVPFPVAVQSLNKCAVLGLRGAGAAATSPFEGFRSRIDPYSVKIKGPNYTFDFSLPSTQRVVSTTWGVVYVAVASGATPYLAFVLDEWAGVVFVQSDTNSVLSLFTISYNSVGSKGAFDQFGIGVKSVNPPSDFNFDRMTYILTAEDPILFEELEMQITDPGYENLVFEMVPSLVTVQGDSTNKTYFEAMPMSPTKVEIKFSSSVSWANIANLQVSYKTVKQMTDYKSGEVFAGSAKLRKRDGSYHTYGGSDTFAFQATNLFGGAGPGGVPSIDTLRDALAKAAYVLNRNVSRIDYEAAIQAYFLGIGKDARIKVFGAEDFGDLFLDSVNGNVVFFVGVVNFYANSDPVLTVPTEVPTDICPYARQYTREELADQLPWLLTDFGSSSNGVVLPVGRSPSEIDQIQTAIRDVSMETATILSEGSMTTRSFTQMFPVFFRLKLAPARGFTLEEASLAVKRALSNKFRWSTFEFVKDLNVSDIYRELDQLAEVDHVLLTNMSAVANSDVANLVVMDLKYQTVLPSDTPNPLLPKWDFRTATPDRLIKIDILGLGGVEIEPYEES